MSKSNSKQKNKHVSSKHKKSTHNHRNSIENDLEYYSGINIEEVDNFEPEFPSNEIYFKKNLNVKTRDVHKTPKHSKESKESKVHKNKHRKKRENTNNVKNEEEAEDVKDIENIEDNNLNKNRISNKSKEHLKSKIHIWLDNDDKIKDLNAKVKKYKERKKAQEDLIIKLIDKFGITEETKIDIHDNNNELRGRVYKQKSVTKGSLKEDIIKSALMELIKDESKVDQLVKKIESKRPINERYYLKRTRGNKNE